MCIYVGAYVYSVEWKALLEILRVCKIVTCLLLKILYDAMFLVYTFANKLSCLGRHLAFL